MKIISINIRGFAKDGAFGWVKDLCREEKPDILCVQETKSKNISMTWATSLWWNSCVGMIQKEAIGNSGGLLLMWDTSSFSVDDFVEKEHFIAIKGNWISTKKESIVANVYGPQDDVGKKLMWETLETLMKKVDTSWLFCGDFNEVRDEEERFNSVYIPSRASRFNDFISNNNLIDIPLGGRKFTRVCDNGIKMSKLDRFLATEKFLTLWEDTSAIVMDRKFSDHCPIMLRDKVVDFGPKPFKFFNEWLNMEGVDKIIRDAWSEEILGRRKDCIFRNKLKNVKNALKEWRSSNFNNVDQEIKEVKAKVEKWEKEAENRTLSEQERLEWMENRNKWLSKERSKANMLRQKARIKWIIEGDENSSYFHTVIRRNYNKINIRGIVINGMWNENVADIKDAIHKHFKSQFEKKCVNRPSIAELEYSYLSDEQRSYLEQPFTEEEVFKALKKGPDGFNMRFYKEYWDLLM
ncbi:uncharacterized protein [Rutidosis leptorrhynchoides]|uniref:uncharacterized protein n=1 Tax=Rutidosis leptorrhynchoides TaxID=125765 RepID=UPI003A99CE84